MNDYKTKEKQSMAALSLLAAMADGKVRDNERAIVNHAMDLLSAKERAEVYQRVLSNNTSINSELIQLDLEKQWTEAIEAARKVCEADDGVNAKEQEFLARMEAFYVASKKQVVSNAGHLPEWALEFSSRAAAIRMLDHPVSPLWMTTLKIQLARSLRNAAKPERLGETKSELITIGRFLLLPDDETIKCLRASGVEVRVDSPEFAFASIAALSHLFDRFYREGEDFSSNEGREAFCQRFTVALGEFSKSLPHIERWLEEGKPMSIAVKEI